MDEPKQRIVRVRRGEAVNPERRARRHLALVQGISPKRARKNAKRLARATREAIAALKSELATAPKPLALSTDPEPPEAA